VGGFVPLKQRALARSQPLSVHLEITYACNWRCVFCYNPRHHDRVRLSAAEWDPVLDDLRDLGTLTVTLTGGEPLTHPEFFAIASAVRARRFALRIFTNGALVTDETARRLAALDPLSVEVSLHGADPAVHDGATGRPGSLQALWSGVDRLRAAGLTVVVKTPLTRENENQLETMIALVADRDLPHRIDPVLTARDGGDRSPLRHGATAAGVRRLME
jgi:MoaA/NifB/PqqE/SkfB family radical SAM enzyme